MGYDNPKQVVEAFKERREADQGRKGELERICATGLSYYVGAQYISQNARGIDRDGRLTRLQTNINPDSNQLRVVSNRVARFTQKSAAATFPAQIDLECFPPDRDAGAESTYRAQLLEDFGNLLMDSSGYLYVRRDANFDRSLWGTAGAGIRVRRTLRKGVQLYGNTVDLPESDVEAFGFTPLEVTLDPFVRHRHLWMHEHVTHHSCWSVRKAREFLGIDIDETQCKTIGDLMPVYLSINTLTDGLLFAEYAKHSQTKGVLIHQIHERDESGRFGLMYLLVEGAGLEDEKMVINFDDPVSPYGGNGLPLAWYHGQRRPDAPYGISDPAMLKDDQDARNLTLSAMFRQQLRSAGWQWLMDVKSLPRGKSEEEFRQMASNTVGGAMFYDSGTTGDKHEAPQLVKYPQPDSQLAQTAAIYEEAMLEQVHRAQVNVGQIKSHTTEAMQQLAVEQSDQVKDITVREDIETDAKLLEVLIGTGLKCIQNRSPCMLKRLVDARFSDTDLGTMDQLNPLHLDAAVRVREGSVRHRSANARRAEIKESVADKTIAPDKARRAMAELDMAVDDEDKFYERECNRIAMEVMRGESFVPISLGEYNPWLLAALRRARLQYTARRDPQIRLRLDTAIELQQSMMAQDAAMMQVGAGAGGVQGAGAQASAAAPGGAADVGNMALEQVVSAFGGGAGSAQPAESLAGAA